MIELGLLEVLMRIKGKTVATAESCTGGMIAKMLTDVPGASQVFQYGIVSYSNEAKMKLLGVKKETLDKYTAVSQQTAIEMANGVRQLAGANIGIAVTGYAGGNEDDYRDPNNGLVYIAVADDTGYEQVCNIHLQYCTRDQVRTAAAQTAIHMINDAITQQND